MSLLAGSYAEFVEAVRFLAQNAEPSHPAASSSGTKTWLSDSRRRLHRVWFPEPHDPDRSLLVPDREYQEAGGATRGGSVLRGVTVITIVRLTHFSVSAMSLATVDKVIAYFEMLEGRARSRSKASSQTKKRG